MVRNFFDLIWKRSVFWQVRRDGKCPKSIPWSQLLGKPHFPRGLVGGVSLGSFEVIEVARRWLPAVSGWVIGHEWVEWAV